MKIKKLSICIPTYNRLTTLTKLISSILNQAFDSWDQIEIVLSDNNSNDGTYEYLKTLESDRRFKINFNITNLGMVPNWQSCLNISSGTYVWMIGSDDCLNKGALQILFEKLKYNYRLINCNNYYSETDEKGQLLDFNISPRSPYTDDISGKRVKDLTVTRSDAFTPIYTVIMQRNDWIEALTLHNSNLSLFSGPRNAIPHAIYISEKLLNYEGYYIGSPLIISSPNIGWREFLPLYYCYFLPYMYKIWKRNSVSSHIIRGHKKELLQVQRVLITEFAKSAKLRRNFKLLKYLYYFGGSIQSYLNLVRYFKSRISIL